MILRKIKFKIDKNNNEYPFNLEWLRNLKSLEFKSPVTFVVGNNGIGKSTLLEALAVNINSTNLSESYYYQMMEYDSVSRLSDVMKCEWSVKNNKGFFFRADDFLNYIRLAIEDSRMSYFLDDGKTPYARDIKHLSHGQAFLAFFNSRLRGKSLYILDEPESPLSPQNQLAFMRLMKEAVELGSQFIIASHSPILLAYPDAEIIEIRDDRVERMAYDDIENVKFMKSFMQDPKRFIHYNFLDE